ncbi:hypothetical protein B296_00039802 [Ensete ventricosum]|uniref:Uncharacterized protein n=1 Tax=Ensete ventricosum TaxID=4639 RepID=A0A426YYR8_ENSVE|nr:hypothetical protein B296_00039802 [Ensete ventricosum]
MVGVAVVARSCSDSSREVQRQGASSNDDTASRGGDWRGVAIVVGDGYGCREEVGQRWIRYGSDNKEVVTGKKGEVERWQRWLRQRRGCAADGGDTSNRQRHECAAAASGGMGAHQLGGAVPNVIAGGEEWLAAAIEKESNTTVKKVGWKLLGSGRGRAAAAAGNEEGKSNVAVVPKELGHAIKKLMLPVIKRAIPFKIMTKDYESQVTDGTPQSRGAQPFALISAARFDRTAPRSSSSAAAGWLAGPRFLSGEMAPISMEAKYKTTVKEPGIPGVLKMVICFALSIRFLRRPLPVHVLLLFSLVSHSWMKI